MKPTLKISLAAIAVLAVAAIAYWLGARANHADSGTATVAAVQVKKEPKILYYRNPMGMPDTSAVPKQDSMGMDYIPVYEGEDEPAVDGSTRIKISMEKVQKLGVKTGQAEMRQLSRTVRALGRVEPDVRRVYTIAPKFEGWVERLHVNASGDVVKTGQA